MRIKRISKIDASISVVGFGCWAAGGDWNRSDDQDSIHAIQRAVDLGVNFFDVAPVYGLGHAELILGEALLGRRQDVLIASKCGLVWDDNNQVTVNATKASLQTEVEDSLRRLQTDYIDLYQVHWPDPNTPISETMQALMDIRQSGKIRHIGVSNFSLALTREAMKYGEVSSFQGLYNMLERNPDNYHNIPLAYRVEDEILPFCAEEGIAFLPYSPIFQGLLTDHYRPNAEFDADDVRTSNPKMNGERQLIYLEMRDKLLQFAQKIDKPLGQIAINWLIEKEAVTSIIVGAQMPAQVEENVGSVSWQLTAELIAEIEAILAPYHETISA